MLAIQVLMGPPIVTVSNDKLIIFHLPQRMLLQVRKAGRKFLRLGKKVPTIMSIYSDLM